jgi:O-antigen/teichoic acid export membrane protein
MNSSSKKAINGIITSAINFFVLIMLQMLVTPLILKISGQDILGAYSIVMQIIGYGIILDFGLAVALNRFLSQSFNKNDNYIQFTKVFNVARYFSLMTSMLIAIFILIILTNLDSVISSNEEIIGSIEKALVIFAVWSILKAFFIVHSHALFASQNMVFVNLVDLIVAVSRLLLSILLVTLEYGLIGLVAANVISEFIGLFIKRLKFNKLYPKINLSWRNLDVKLSRKIFSFGLTYWGVNVAIVMTIGSDSIVIGHLYGVALASVFYTTKIPSYLITQIIYKISDNTAPVFNEVISENNHNRARFYYYRVLLFSLLLAIPAAIAIIKFNKDVVTLWVGVEQYAGDLMTFALAMFVVTQVVNHVNAMVVVAIGDMKYWIHLSLFTAFMTILSSYFLGRAYGIEWIMISISIMDIPTLVFLIFRSAERLKIKGEEVLVRIIKPVALVSLPLVGWVLYTAEVDKVITLSGTILEIFTFLALWLILIYGLGVEHSDRELIKYKIYRCKKWLF